LRLLQLQVKFPSGSSDPGDSWFAPRSKILALALAVLALSLLLTGCPKKEGPPNARISTSNRFPESAVVPGAVAFNGERAMEHVKKQLAIGPRVGRFAGTLRAPAVTLSAR